MNIEYRVKYYLGNLYEMFKNNQKIDYRVYLNEKEEIKEHSEFSKIIKEYEEFISKFYTLLESKSNLPIDVIKYEIMKYI